jgi:hypothetical protein
MGLTLLGQCCLHWPVVGTAVMVHAASLAVVAVVVAEAAACVPWQGLLAMQ